MTKIDLLEMLTRIAREHRLDANASLTRNDHMHVWREGDLEQTAIDALLTDFINKVATFQGVDYALYSKDLSDPENRERDRTRRES